MYLLPHVFIYFTSLTLPVLSHTFSHSLLISYDVYAPNETPLFHFYSSPAQNKKMGIQKFWDFEWGKRFPIMFESTRRLRHKVKTRLPFVTNKKKKGYDNSITLFVENIIL